MTALVPGDTSPDSGIVTVVDKNGKDTHIQKTVVKGNPLPPTPDKDQTYRYVKKTTRNGK